jgi:hypothetical protein
VRIRAIEICIELNQWLAVVLLLASFAVGDKYQGAAKWATKVIFLNKKIKKFKLL